MKKTKCFNCGGIFRSGSEKKLHKQKYPNGGCKGMIPINQLQGRTIMEEEKENQEIETEEPKEALKEIKTIKMPKEQAKEEWKKYCEVLKTRKEKYLKVMKDAHYQMKEGNELIDIYKVMKKAGLNENNEPRLAIARADISKVTFCKTDEGCGNFEMGGASKDDVNLPQKIFGVHWKREDGAADNSWRIENKRIRTKVPVVPIELLPNGDLSNYYILWESTEWEELPETKDPFLMKRISENLFAILGSWDLTELEQSIISGGK